MSYLLDTHAVIWYLEESGELPQKVMKVIDDTAIDVCICAVSLWEIAIKINLGKLDMGLTLGELLDLVKTRNFHIVQIEDSHLLPLLNLPYLHKDPFDRLLISTAMAERLTIITVDENIQKYDVSWIWQ